MESNVCLIYAGRSAMPTAVQARRSDPITLGMRTVTRRLTVLVGLDFDGRSMRAATRLPATGEDFRDPSPPRK